MIMKINICTKSKSAYNDLPSRKDSNVKNREPIALFISQRTNLLIALS